MPLTRKYKRLKFKKGEQSKFLRLAAKSVGSLRKLAKLLGLKWGTFWYYLNEQITLPYTWLEKLLPFTNLKEEYIISECVEKILPFNWGAVIGGTKTSKINMARLRADPKFKELWIRHCKKAGAAIKNGFIKNWDIGFRKAGRRNVIGPKGENMFNEAEKNIALWLIKHNKSYEYERLIKINGKFYFPDFIVGNVIIERCGLCTEKYLKLLKRKFYDYRNYWNGRIIVICPKNLLKPIKRLISSNSKFKIINENNLDDGLSSVAW